MIAISMRATEIHYPSGASERRDALAQNWHSFIKQTLPGQFIFPVPNTCNDAVNMLRLLPVRGLILSGGEDWGVHQERDETERLLFEYARKEGWPILGVCRGAQVINHLLGGSVRPDLNNGHAGQRHESRILPNPFFNNDRLEVNSFHENIIMPEDLGAGLQIFGLAPDSSVEAFFSSDGNMAGIVWHPERERMPNDHDVLMMTKLFGRDMR